MCGWCSKHFSDHARWFKDIVEHQKDGCLKSDYDHDIVASTSPPRYQGNPQAPSTFNTAVMAGLKQFSPSTSSQAASPQLSPLSDTPADPELDISMSPGSDANDLIAAFPPFPSSSEASQLTCDDSMAMNPMMCEFDGTFAQSAELDGTSGDAQPSSFNFINSLQQNPLLGLGVGLSSENLPQLYSYADTRPLPPLTPAPPPSSPPFRYVYPRNTLSKIRRCADERDLHYW